VTRDLNRISPVLWRRAVPSVLLPFALHALAREVDGAVGTLLHTTLDLPDFVVRALGLLDPGRVLLAVLGWSAAGVVVWVALAAARAARERSGLAAALEAEAAGLGPLYLRPILTGLALLSLAARPTYPYGFTLPVALTQDWAVAQDAAAVAALVAARLPAIRLPAPGAGAIFFVSFLAYGLLSPPWARDWDGHPGNEPKTLRMAVALGHGLTLDVEGVSGPMERLPTRPILSSAWTAARTAAREAARLESAMLHGGYGGVGAAAIRATRVTRQTVRGKEGGIYYVLAPGPAFLLAPALRVDRALNLARGTEGRLAVTLLLWNAVAAALVAAVFLLARDATARPGLAAAVAGFFALVPPVLFYFYQFYPETLGALALAIALRLILFRTWWTTRTAWGLGLLLATLPWLHQKFLPLWLVLVAMAGLRAVHEMVHLRALAGLAIPQVLSLYLTALYNFAVTGSARPDALYLAWGPGGVTSERLGQGLFGLALDARYGLAPYAPLYVLALTGAFLFRGRPSRLGWAFPAAAVYYVTVASADNWSGAVCSLGRYVMPLAPLAVVLVAVVLDRTVSRRGALAFTLTLGAWTALVALALWRDPLASNDCAVLLGKSVFADGNVYIPNLFIRTWSEGAPGLFARIGAWIAVAAAAAVWLRRAAIGRAGLSPARALAGMTAVILSAALLLERWPSSRTAPRFPDALDLGGGTVVYVAGADVRDDYARVAGDEVDLLVRSRAPLRGLTLTAEGEGIVRVPGRPPVALSPRGTRVEVPLQPLVTLAGRRGVEETLYRQAIVLDGPRGAVLRFEVPPSARDGMPVVVLEEPLRDDAVAGLVPVHVAVDEVAVEDLVGGDRSDEAREVVDEARPVGGGPGAPRLDLLRAQVLVPDLVGPGIDGDRQGDPARAQQLGQAVHVLPGQLQPFPPIGLEHVVVDGP
jgi:hypothetical protein